MASTRILVKTLINSLIKEVFYWKMPKRIKIVGMHRQLLFIVY